MRDSRHESSALEGVAARIDQLRRAAAGEDVGAQWALSLTHDLVKAQARIEACGGRAGFVGLYDGERRVRARLIEVNSAAGTGSARWLLDDLEARRYGRRFVTVALVGSPGRVHKELGLAEQYESAPGMARIRAGRSSFDRSVVEVVRTGCMWGSDATRAAREIQ